MSHSQIIKAIKAVTELLKLNQHPATQLQVGVKEQAQAAISTLLQMI